MSKKEFAQWLVYVLVRVFVCLIQTLPLESCQHLARCLAFLACDILRVREQVVTDNLRSVFPDLSADERHVLARRMWEHLFLMICEIAHAPRKIHRTNWTQFIDMPNRQGFVSRLLDSRAKIVVSAHFGNFEVAGYACGLLGFPTFTVARRLDNPYLDRYVNRFRGANGQFIIPKDGSANQIQTILSAGGALTLLGDQHAGTKGCWIDFFGRPASCHKAIAVFSLTTGAPLLVAYAKRTRRPLHFEAGLFAIADPADDGDEMTGVKPLTQWYNSKLEQLILTAPDQYWWLHRRWKPPPKRQTAHLQQRQLRRSA